MLIMGIFAACIPGANAADQSKKEKYDAAYESLAAYMNDEDTAELKEIFTAFASLGSYEYSTGFMLYTNVLIGIESDNYGFAQSNINMMRKDAKFVSYLSETEIFGSIDDIENYANGRSAEKEGDLLSAMAYYESASSYLDSSGRLCEMQSEIYAAAMAAFELGTYEGYAECVSLFEKLAAQKYSDSEGYLINAKIMMEVTKPCEHDWSAATASEPETCSVCGLTREKTQIKVGEIITFGSYEQDNDTGNGKEPIEWQVLEIKDGKVLLISKYGLDAKPYNTEWAEVTWETCTLRSWLNNEFMKAAFTGEEQGRIALTNVDNSKSQGYSGYNTTDGNDTQDKIFLLSYAEANRYFGVTLENKNNTESQISPTAYAESNGAFVSDVYKTADGANAGYWWLRSPGYYQNDASRVETDGSLNYRNVNYAAVCVLPALWMNLES